MDYNVVDDDDDEDEDEDDDDDDDNDDDDAASNLCEPAQLKCTWTCHKRHCVQKFTWEMPYPYPMASILCEPAQS